MNLHRYRPLCLFAAGALLSLAASAQRRGGAGQAPPQDLQFRFMGPAVGNRISAAAGIPGDPTTYYAGAASGGVWKSTDGGITWAPIFDTEAAQAIGALAVSASNHNIVWAGTGEAWAIRDSDMMGDGIYKSTDAGRYLAATWACGKPAASGASSSIPPIRRSSMPAPPGASPGRSRSAAFSRPPMAARPGTASCSPTPTPAAPASPWTRSDPNTLFAGTWQAVMHTYGMFSGGPGSAVYRHARCRRHTGRSWKATACRTLPVGKIDVAIAPTNSKRVYALIQTADQGSIWRSDDGGENWTNGSWQRALIGRAGYYIHLAVSPSNPDEVLVANSSFWLSTDGGKSFRSRALGRRHARYLDRPHRRQPHPGDPRRRHVHDHRPRRRPPPASPCPSARCTTWPWITTCPTHLQQHAGRRHHARPQHHAGSRPERARPGQAGGAATAGAAAAWARGSTAWAAANPASRCPTSPTPTSSGPPATATKSRATTPAPNWPAPSARGCTRSIPSPTKRNYRCHWTAPLAIDPFDHNTVYYGCQMILRTTNGGMTWTEISPDLSTRDPSRIVSSGGIVGDNLGQFYGEVVFAIAPSEIQRGLIWAGTNDGKVWYTRDAGAQLGGRHREYRGPAAVGRGIEDRAVAFRRRHGLYRGGFPPDGQPRSLALQDHRFRQDLDQDQRRPAPQTIRWPTRA